MQPLVGDRHGRVDGRLSVLIGEMGTGHVDYNKFFGCVCVLGAGLVLQASVNVASRKALKTWLGMLQAMPCAYVSS